MSPTVNPDPVSPATLPPVKAGVRSSEFIVCVIIFVLAAAGLLSGKLDAVWFTLLLALLGVVYNNIRATLKTAHLDTYASLLETAYENAPFNVPPIKPAAPTETPNSASPSTADAPLPPEEISFSPIPYPPQPSGFTKG